MDGTDGGGEPAFFLPAGNVEELESDLFYLVELWHIAPESVMRLPYSRRKRMAERKNELESKRRGAQESAAARARSRGRR